MSEAWERQRGESAKAFEAFRLYLDMGPTRSGQAVGERLAKSRQLMSRWATRWAWRDRSVAWDSELSRKALEGEAEARREANAFHRRGGRWLAQKALLRLLGNEELGYRPLDVNGLTAADVVRLWEAGVKSERLGLGEATEAIDIRSIREDAVRLAIEAGLDPDEALEEVDRILHRRNEA